MLGKKLRTGYNYLIGYNLSDAKRNGEYRFIKSYLKPSMVYFDVGANSGYFTKDVLGFVEGCEVHCFEPVPSTFDALTDNLSGKDNVTLNNFGLSSKNTTMTIHMFGEGHSSGMNSVHREDLGPDVGIQKTDSVDVEMQTLDQYVENNSVSHIDYLKVDVEGDEINVIRGAKESIAKGVIDVIHFEYGATFIHANATLKQVYELLEPNGFSLYRLLPYGKKRVKSFDAVYGVENFQHSNWVAIKDK